VCSVSLDAHENSLNKYEIIVMDAVDWLRALILCRNDKFLVRIKVLDKSPNVICWVCFKFRGATD
jgi:hypothetical protein